MASKEEISPEEMKLLRELTLSQNPALYYGSGIKSGSNQPLKEVARFERTTGGTTSSVYEGGLEFEGQLLDVGRYSRLSRTITPGSPILEQDETQTDQPLVGTPPPTTQGTFLTDSHPTTPL